MGKSLYDLSPAAREVFDAAGPDIKGWCFEGSKEDLRQTHVTQPTVFAVAMAAHAALIEALGDGGSDGGGIEIAGLAGFSLGEYAALTAAGCIRGLGEALDIIRKRGEYMAEAGRGEDGGQRGGMAALYGERQAIADCIDAVREGDVLEATNFNSPLQTTVAGDLAALDRLRKRARGTEGLKFVPLSVSAAFHSSMMKPASEKLALALEALDLAEPKTPVYANLTGRDIMEGRPAGVGAAEWLRGRLTLQSMNPVRWQETLERMSGDGIGLFIELGPGKTLSGFVGKTLPGAAALNVEDAESLGAALAEIRGLGGC
jgi:[acyl-carrier-protein] S-malonyltransferase